MTTTEIRERRELFKALAGRWRTPRGTFWTSRISRCTRIKVPVPDGMMGAAKTEAVEIYKRKTAAGARDMELYGRPQGAVRVLWLGRLVEMAWSLLTGAPMQEIFEGKDVDGGFDFLHAGIRIDIKSRMRAGGGLYCSGRNGFVADVAVLAWPFRATGEQIGRDGIKSWVEFIGWISRGEFERDAAPEMFGKHRIEKFMAWEELNSLDELWILLGMDWPDDEWEGLIGKAVGRHG